MKNQKFLKIAGVLLFSALKALYTVPSRTLGIHDGLLVFLSLVVTMIFPGCSQVLLDLA